MSTNHHIISIRLARDGDAPALARLAVLDSGAVPEGALLVAEVGRELWAAAPVAGGPAIADPFRPSGDAVAMLRLRARQLRDERPPRIRFARRASRMPRVLLRTVR